MPDAELGPIFIVSERLREVAEFYEGLVGLPVTSRDADHHVWFRAGDRDVVVHAPEPEPGTDFTPNERGVLLWFRTERDLAEVARSARERGIRHWGPFEGGRRELLYTLDPDGNMVGIFRPKEPAPASRTGGAFDVPIAHSVLVRASAEQAYDAFATAGGLDAWFTSGATIDARPGGEMVWRWKDWGPDRITDEARGQVHVADRPRRFAFDWESGDDRPTLVDVTFEERDDGTVVRLRETGYSDTERGRRACLNCASGWGEALALMKIWLEHGIRY